jgi:hypothetical protein
VRCIEVVFNFDSVSKESTVQGPVLCFSFFIVSTRDVTHDCSNSIDCVGAQGSFKVKFNKLKDIGLIRCEDSFHLSSVVWTTQNR